MTHQRFPFLHHIPEGRGDEDAYGAGLVDVFLGWDHFLFYILDAGSW
jgi:hypothetical protein